MTKWEYCILLQTPLGVEPGFIVYKITPTGLKDMKKLSIREHPTFRTLAEGLSSLIAELGIDGWEITEVNVDALETFKKNLGMHNPLMFKRPLEGNATTH